MTNGQQKRLINWPLLPLPDANGRLSFPGLEDSVRQSIQIILRTKPGERLMRPAFGGGLERMVHEQNTLATRAAISDLITTSLAKWEPRIVLDRVDVWQIEDRPTEVRCEIAYRIRRTNVAKQIGVTMALEA